MTELFDQLILLGTGGAITAAITYVFTNRWQGNQYKIEVKEKILKSFNQSIQTAYMEQYNFVRDLLFYQNDYDAIDDELDGPISTKRKNNNNFKKPSKEVYQEYQDFRKNQHLVRKELKLLLEYVELYVNGSSVYEKLKEYPPNSRKISQIIFLMVESEDRSTFNKHKEQFLNEFPPLSDNVKECEKKLSSLKFNIISKNSKLFHI